MTVTAIGVEYQAIVSNATDLPAECKGRWKIDCGQCDWGLDIAGPSYRA